MSDHSVDVEWLRNGATFGPRFIRNHTWTFDSGVVISASSAPHLQGDPSRVDPEEAYVAAISSCHMLWFLHLAAEHDLAVDRYFDRAVGTMERTEEDGKVWITHVELHPDIVWSGRRPSEDEINDLHHQSHERCFIANSVRTMITVSAP
jgi:organic hydroperoxide reductase OsmC/OhrA